MGDPAEDRVVEFGSGAVGDDQVAEISQLVVTVPGRQTTSGVGAENEEQRPITLGEFFEGRNRITRSCTLYFDVTHIEDLLALGGEANHLQSLLTRRNHPVTDLLPR